MNRVIRRIRSLAIAAVTLLPALAHAQALTPEQTLKHGADIFAQTCTQSYCHGANGAAGGAPKLAKRGFTANYIEKVVTYGISGTPMPAWGQILPLAEVRAVIAYVQSLNGITASNAGPPPTLSGEAARGRDLFFDPQHLQRCSNCHRVSDRGVPVTPTIASIPANAAALRKLATPQVSTATLDGRTFPALVASQIPKETKLYDLSSFPPVLRTAAPDSVKTSEGNSWNHSTVLGNYSDSELDAILLFLQTGKQ